MTNFVEIMETRIRKTCIKKYYPVGETKIGIVYNTSRYKIDLETIDCKDNEMREDLLTILDNLL